MSDPFGLERFVRAQDEHNTYEEAVDELRAGRKTSHWMWFVFPQVAGLGMTPTSQLYAIGSLAEAQAYLAHPVLGPRLRECARILVELGRSDPEAILGTVDAMKLRSSMTLFALADPGEPLFRAVLDQYYDGQADALTERLLSGLT